MYIEILKSKIHRVKVTQAELHYVGSITIDEDLMDAANIIAHEKVQVVNINNGERFTTYIIKAKRGSGIISLNGAAARKAHIGDPLIICTYGTVPEKDAISFRPTIVLVNECNQIKEIKSI